MCSRRGCCACSVPSISAGRRGVSAFGGYNTTYNGNTATVGSSRFYLSERLRLCRRHDLSRPRPRPVTALRRRRRHQLNPSLRGTRAAAAAMPSRPASMAPRITVRLTSPARSPSPITGSPPTASRSAISSPPASKAKATPRAAKPAIAMACRSPAISSA